jgi:hypothetical protein
MGELAVNVPDISVPLMVAASLCAAVGIDRTPRAKAPSSAPNPKSPIVRN